MIRRVDATKKGAQYIADTLQERVSLAMVHLEGAVRPGEVFSVVPFMAPFREQLSHRTAEGTSSPVLNQKTECIKQLLTKTRKGLSDVAKASGTAVLDSLESSTLASLDSQILCPPELVIDAKAAVESAVEKMQAILRPVEACSSAASAFAPTLRDRIESIPRETVEEQENLRLTYDMQVSSAVEGLRVSCANVGTESDFDIVQRNAQKWTAQVAIDRTKSGKRRTASVESSPRIQGAPAVAMKLRSHST